MRRRSTSYAGFVFLMTVGTLSAAAQDRRAVPLEQLDRPAVSATPIQADDDRRAVPPVQLDRPALAPNSTQAVPPSSTPADSGQSAPSDNWTWLADTYWIVPKAYLPAVVFDPSTQLLAPLSDQTVYHITGYRAGYFWGKNVTEVGTGQVTCASLVGSITPEGRILLSFTVVSGNSVTQQVGFGQMQLIDNQRQWSMENQTTATNFAHWAFMVQAQPGDANWNALPGVGVSVPLFLAQCPGNGPQPITVPAPW